MKRFLLFFGVGLAALVGFLVVTAVQFVPQKIESDTSSLAVPSPDGQMLAQKLSEAVRFKTISYESGNPDDYAAFAAFSAWLEGAYPSVFEQLTLHRINQHTLLFHWKGQTTQAPVMFSAHYDVVPVNAGTEGDWAHPPFAGVIADGLIWGRGTLDDKSAVIALMSSVESLLAQQFTPQRDIYLAFTHDEEVGSELGAESVTEWFESRNIQLAWSLDEGSFVLKDILPGIDKGIASINVAEKGFLTLKLIAKGKGGHSSMPPDETAVSILANAIVNLKSQAMPGGLEGLAGKMYGDIARHMSFSKRLLFANQWLFDPVLNNILSGSVTGNAMLRTTIAPTMLSGSVKSNVLPQEATATVNFRLHPRDSVASVTAWVNAMIDDERVSVEALESFEPSIVASSSTAGFNDLVAVTKAVYPNSIITPGLTIAATDSRFYARMTDAYRFNPMIITNEDIAGFHGTNEKISIENMVNAVKFYSTLMLQQ